MKATVLFCGAGGSTIGLKQAGYTTVGYDVWDVAVATHNLNGMPAFIHDLSDERHDGAIDDCDLLWASPPCQPFSAAGDQEGEADERDGFPWTLRIVGRLLPSVVIVENVKGLTFAKHDEYVARIYSAFRVLGYEVEWKVLNSADYGVPQTRERLFIIARRDGAPITWPMPTHTEQPGMFTEPWVSMADALGWNDDRVLDPNADRGIGVRERHGERPLVPIERPAPCMTSRPDTPWRWVLDYRQTDGRKGEPITLDVTNRPAPTVSTQSGSQWVFTRPATTIAGDIAAGRTGHDRAGTDAIRLTIPELARLQDFPDGYQFLGTKTAQARQVGNAVCPTMARVLSGANRPVSHASRVPA